MHFRCITERRKHVITHSPLRFQLDVHTHITDPDTLESMRFEKALLTPLFQDGTLSKFPGATMYAVCYGELCAYGPDPEHPELCEHARLLATHTASFPDCQSDLHKGTRHSAFQGHWELNESAPCASCRRRQRDYTPVHILAR